MHSLGDRAHRHLEARILLEKWRRRFRPHHEVRIRGIRRANDFAGHRPGLRNSGDVSFAPLLSQPGKLRHVRIPLARSSPVPHTSHIEIGLNQHCHRRRLGLRWLHQDPSPPREQQQQARSQAYNPVAQGRDRQASYDECIRRNEQIGDSVNARPRSEPIHQLVVDLRIPQLIPRNARYPRRCKIERHPNDRRRREREPDLARSTANQGDAQPEQSKVQPQHKAEADQQQRRRQGRHIAVALHCVSDPVAVPAIPEHSTEIAEQKSPANSVLFVRVAGKQRPQQRHQREPGEQRAPGQHGTGQRKRQFQKSSREAGRGPQCPRMAMHIGPS